MRSSRSGPATGSGRLRALEQRFSALRLNQTKGSGIITTVITANFVTAALKLTRIGNSIGVILPKDMLARLKVEKGDTLHVTDTPDGLRLTPHDPRFAVQMKQVRRIAKKRRAVLRELAK